MKTNENTAVKVTLTTIVVNIALSVIKLIAGIVAKSGAMVSDAVHSGSDVLSSVIVIVGMNIAGKESDASHPYGHERMECVAAIVLAVVLFLTGIFIGANGAYKIKSGTVTSSPLSIAALCAAAISIITKEAMYYYTMKYAKQLNSSAMKADAWHHRSDALSSVGSLAGVGGAMLGFKFADPVASIIICVFIAKAAIDIFKDAVLKMVDTACDDKTVDEIKSIIFSFNEVKRIDVLKTRLFGSKIYADIEISLDGNLSLYEAHSIAHNIHDALENRLPQLKHCMVHINPFQENTTNK